MARAVCGMVAGDHDGADARAAALRDRLARLGARRVLEARETEEDEIAFDVLLALAGKPPLREREDPERLGGEQRDRLPEARSRRVVERLAARGRAEPRAALEDRLPARP